MHLAALLVERALFQIALRLTRTGLRTAADGTLRDYQPRHGSCDVTATVRHAKLCWH